MVFLDLGAKHNGYVCDLSRCTVAGKASDEKRRLLDTSLEIFTRVLEALKPGVPIKVIHRIAEDIAVRASYEDAFMPTGFGHGLGTSLIELPSLRPPGDRPFDAGMVFVLEPMLVRYNVGTAVVEETVLVTETGAETLSGVEWQTWYLSELESPISATQMDELTIMQRVVSLIASSTEIVCALGCEERLVGRSHECDYPASVKKLAICTEPKFNVEGTSREIDERVKAALRQDALSVYRVHADRLQELQPDVIITQSQCEVCAVSLRDVEEAVCEWLDSRPQIVSLEPNALDDVFADIRRVASALEVPERGEELVTQMQERMAAIAERARTAPARPTVACIEWIDPLMAAGNWMPELVDLAGGVNVFGEAGKHAPWMSWEELRGKDPDVIVALPCGWDIERARQEMPALTERAGWSDLKAVRNGRVVVADGNQFFNRPGPRLVESLEILAEVLHPDLFRFGHEGKGWQHL